MKFSQNDEEDIISSFFGDRPGKFLDIGAYTGKELSNTWKLAQAGWEGVLVEASPDVFVTLAKNYAGNKRVKLINGLVGSVPGLMKFHNSTGACATACEDHYLKWREHTPDYTEIHLPVLPVNVLLKSVGVDFDFISIDAEGMDYEILSRFPLVTMPTKMICVEWNYGKKEIEAFLWKMNFKPVATNAENIIAVRE